MPVGDRGVYNIWDLRDQARRRLPRAFFEFVDRGSEDEVALANNRAALERIKLRPRVLVDVSERSQEITLFGRRQSSPLVIGPTGIADLLWYRGEVALAGAAAGVGIPFTQVTSSTTPVERVAAAATAGVGWGAGGLWSGTLRDGVDVLILWIRPCCLCSPVRPDPGRPLCASGW